MKRFIMLAVLGVCFVCGSLSVFAEEKEEAGKTAEEILDQMVMIPYDYQSKAFVHGQLIEMYDDYTIVQRDGRILVPIRLMSRLAYYSGQDNNNWEAVWDAQTPDEVLLKNDLLGKKIKFTVGSKEMVVNNEPLMTDAAPQKINGGIYLPLRNAAIALDKEIIWHDGLILMGKENINTQDPQMAGLLKQIKAILTDTRKRIEFGDALFPVARFGDTAYYYQRFYKDNGETQAFYKQKNGQKAVRVPLQGDPILDSARIINGELYYVSLENKKSMLYAYDFAGNQSRKISSLGDWNPRDGWLSDLSVIDNEVYIILHSGDLTMGSETLYKVKDGSLASVADAKSFNAYVKTKQYLYSSDFTPMFSLADNLKRTDLATGETVSIGNPEYAYGINRSIGEGSVGYSTNDSLYVKDGYLYTLGVKDNDPEDRTALYKINPQDRSQIKLASPAGDFWMIGDQIFYIDPVTGYLHGVGLDGANDETVVNRKVANVIFYNGGIYYTGDVKTAGIYDQGTLYRYDIANHRETRLSDRAVTSFYVGKAGVFYVSKGYEMGLYKVDESGRNIRLVNDSIDTAVLSDDGMIYTLAYKKGIFIVK
ncbi:DUF5050 domain-containing protein [Paenibacillus sp. M1]|uniref:DUF5050 domain-containing protein n=1 Tax=Paenibacillus haidiansis TaxID=1574488 RepID=A0ABU7VPS7_9BACL